MDLFEYAKSKTLDQESPLASRLRPTTLDEVVGQQHIIGKDTLLYRAIKADKLTSVIFYGPPGTGKTTLAKVIANTTSAEFTQINATVAGKKDMEAVVKEAQQNLGMYGKKTILFITAMMQRELSLNLGEITVSVSVHQKCLKCRKNFGHWMENRKTAALKLRLKNIPQKS